MSSASSAGSGRAILTEREPVGGGLQRVRLRVGRATATTHARHGQYVEIRHDPFTDREEPAPASVTTTPSAARGYFAIASAPGEPTWDVIVRDAGAMGERLRDLPLGAEVLISDALGNGWPLEDTAGHPLVVAVTGSAIGAVLSTIGARIASGDARHTYLLYGVRDRNEIALASELEAMRGAGVDVAICLSREHVDEPGFYKGYVQHAAQERTWELGAGLIFAAGNDAMLEAMREAAPALGIAPDAVRFNM